MFLFLINYVRPLNEVDAVLERHVQFLDRNYEAGKFIFSGRRNPRIGGIILCKSDSLEEAQKIAAEDPFSQTGVAKYEIIEFTASKYAKGFEQFL
jgi:uncharacterized protein YciI